MEPADALSTVAEIAIAFAGFSGMIVALSRREQGSLFPEDRIRIAVLIAASLSTTAFALLPIALWEVAGGASLVWTLSSAAYAPYGIAVIMLSLRDARHARLEDPTVVIRASSLPLYASTYVGFPFVITLQLANVALWHQFTPFFVALLWGLVGCAIAFAGLVRSLHR